MTDKQKLVESLRVAHSQAAEAENELRLQGNADAADRFARRARELSVEIFLLLAGGPEEWANSAGQLRVAVATVKLQAAVDGMKRRTQVSERVVDALQVLDDLMAEARDARLPGGSSSDRTMLAGGGGGGPRPA
jgi:hypothetical protein